MIAQADQNSQKREFHHGLLCSPNFTHQSWSKVLARPKLKKKPMLSATAVTSTHLCAILCFNAIQHDTEAIEFALKITLRINTDRYESGDVTNSVTTIMIGRKRAADRAHPQMMNGARVIRRRKSRSDGSAVAPAGIALQDIFHLDLQLLADISSLLLNRHSTRLH